ncbi:RNA polymerase sigma-70 factor [compost metagenome]
MSGCAAFSGRSALRSWLTAILKNKLVDLIRDRARYHEMDADDDQALPLECDAARPDELAEHRERLAISQDSLFVRLHRARKQLLC